MGNIYKRSGNGWTRLNGKLRHISVASDGTVWGVTKSYGIYRRDGSKWTKIPGGLKQIDVGSRTNIWGVNKDGYVYKYNNKNGWTMMPDRLKHVSVGADGTVMGVNSANNVYLFDAKTNTWKPVCGGLNYIEVGSRSQIWGKNSKGQIFRATKSVQSQYQPPTKSPTKKPTAQNVLVVANARLDTWTRPTETQNGGHAEAAAQAANIGQLALVVVHVFHEEAVRREPRRIRLIWI